MTIEELYDMTVLLEHINRGGKKNCRDVNRVYKNIPLPIKNATKKEKIRRVWGGDSWINPDPRFPKDR